MAIRPFAKHISINLFSRKLDKVSLLVFEGVDNMRHSWPTSAESGKNSTRNILNRFPFCCQHVRHISFLCEDCSGEILQMSSDVDYCSESAMSALDSSISHLVI